MSLVEKLIGAKYPVKDIKTNKVSGYKTITSASMAADVGGVIVNLDDNKSSVLLPMAEAFRLIESSDESNS